MRKADLFVVAAYGLIFGDKTLAIPKIACVNLHASILPDFRGASPISAAILEGRASTGVSLMVMERGLDSGPVIATESIPIKPEATTGALTAELAAVGARLTRDYLADFAAGRIIPKSQLTEAASFVRPLTKADGWIDWSMPANEIERHVRAMWPWPRAWTEIDGSIVQIHQSDIANGDQNLNGPVGSISEDQRYPVVKCGEGYLRLLRVQFPGKQSVDASDALGNGQLRTGLVLNGAMPERSPMVARPNGENATIV